MFTHAMFTQNNNYEGAIKWAHIYRRTYTQIENLWLIFFFCIVVRKKKRNKTKIIQCDNLFATAHMCAVFFCLHIQSCTRMANGHCRFPEIEFMHILLIECVFLLYLQDQDTESRKHQKSKVKVKRNAHEPHSQWIN